MGLLNSVSHWEISMEGRAKEHMTNEGKSQEEWKTYLKVKATCAALNRGFTTGL